MVIMMGYILATWAMVVNRFFSAVVRIRTDRGHKVVNSGPYHFIRHPGYAGGLLGFIAMPFLLCSLWAGLPALIAIVVTIYRTAREDAWPFTAEFAGLCGILFSNQIPPAPSDLVIYMTMLPESPISILKNFSQELLQLLQNRMVMQPVIAGSSIWETRR